MAPKISPNICEQVMIISLTHKSVMSLVMHEFIRSRDQVAVKKSFDMQAWCGVQLNFIGDSHAQ